MKIKFFKKEKNFKKAKESLQSNINFYWRLIVFFMFIATLLSFFFGYYLFMQINKESVLPASSDSGKAEKVRKERIDQILEYFSAREQKSNEILNSPAPIADPSL